jgi:uncharacterized membrane protein YphA (DoxX/SURF4 family)
MFGQASIEEPRNVLGDWILRGAIGLIFIGIGWAKFATGPDSWVKFFDELGWGQWFRYFTGVVEIAGGVLVLIPRTMKAGLALLICTMASAALILTFALGRPAESVFSGALCVLLAVFLWNRSD